METTYYTIKEVAGILKVSVSTVRRAIGMGDLKATRVGTQGQIRVAESTLDRYVAERENGSAAGSGAGRRGASNGNGGEGINGSGRRGMRRHNSGSATRTPTATRRVTAGSEAVLLEGKHTKGAWWKVICADVITGLRLIEDESVNCVVTSPPYYWQRDYGVEGQIGHEDSVDGYVSALVATFEEAKRVLTTDGVVFLNLGDTYYSAKGRPHGRDKKHNGRQMARQTLRAVDGPGLGLPRKSLIGIPWRVALAMQASGWTLRSAAIWQRPGSLPEPTAKDRPWRTYEHVFIFSTGPRYWFNRDGLNGDEDIWQIVARPENPGSHFAPYPRELVDRCLACGCPPGGTVLDPFVGSGTTMLQALRRGSPAIGIDISTTYCNFIEHRIATELHSVPATKQQARHNAAAPR